MIKPPIKFTKMHGLGNDFVVIDTINSHWNKENYSIPRLADRHVGIGFDQLLIIEKSPRADFACRIFNADGSEAEQCGNGMRCVVRFVHENQLAHKKNFTIETLSGIVEASLHDYSHITVSMGIPQFKPEKIPFLIETQANYYLLSLQANKAPLTISVLSMGNPHAILIVPQLKNFPVNKIGAKISRHILFPKGANVGFMEIVNQKQVRLRTYERGVGETLACGTNACAATVAGIINHLLDRQVTVELTQGTLLIEWPGDQQPVKMTGPAETSFVGEISAIR